jgi:hypothetical protein
MFKLSLEAKECKLDGLVCCENIPLDIINSLIDSKLLKDSFNEYKNRLVSNERLMLQNYKNLYKHKKFNITYKRSIPYGRVCADKGLSVFGMRKEIRHTLCSDKYIDIDIVNCHCVILSQICSHNNIDCQNLNQYIKNRNNIIDEICIIYNITDKLLVKNLFISLIFGGTFEWWLTKNKLNKIDNDITNFIINYQNELNNIKNIIVDHNKNLQEVIIKQKLEQKIKKYNIINTTFSIFLQDYENQILEQIYIYCYNNNYIKKNNCILCYDGIMIYKKNYKSKLCSELEKHIKQSLGFELNLIIKSMNDGYTTQEIKNNYYDRFDIILSDSEL